MNVLQIIQTIFAVVSQLGPVLSSLSTDAQALYADLQAAFNDLMSVVSSWGTPTPAQLSNATDLLAKADALLSSDEFKAATAKA